MTYKLDEFAKQVCCSLRLTSLIISRARQIIRKAPIFVDTKMDDPVQIALLELLQKKIKLSDGNVPPQISESKKAEKSL